MPKHLRAPPQVSARLTWFKVAEHPALSTFMTVVICANIALMGCVYHGQPESFHAFVDGASTAFTVIYAAEAAVKLIGLSPMGYPRPALAYCALDHRLNGNSAGDPPDCGARTRVHWFGASALTSTNPTRIRPIDCIFSG